MSAADSDATFYLIPLLPCHCITHELAWLHAKLKQNFIEMFCRQPPMANLSMRHFYATSRQLLLVLTVLSRAILLMFLGKFVPDLQRLKYFHLFLQVHNKQ